MEPLNENPAVDLLVIGYGNTLRGDDAAGRRVAQAMEKLHLPGVRVLSCDLLTPELADPVAGAQKVVFVDASVEAVATVQIRELEPAESSQILAHAADPRTLLALARDVFGQAPQAWWVTIPAENLGIGEDLSMKTRVGVEEAIRQIRIICH
ncbi:MAG TPA: hydrogenase maturation protease [Verrucomicrobiae bacterium]|nr:hydrogenase maturation protease [Verrucomicrobiae bacterium]